MPNNNKFENFISKTKIYLVVIAILLIIICTQNTEFIIPAIIIYVLLIAYTGWTHNKKVTELTKHIEDLTTSVDTTAKNNLINSPFPLVIAETDGTIIWKSVKFVNEFVNTDIKNILKELLQELKKEVENNKKYNSIKTKLKIGKKTYEVLGEYVKSKKKKQTEYMMTLYFIDITKHEKAIQEIKDINTCVGILVVDNYDEMMQRVSDERKPQITAEVEKVIYDWAASTNGIIIKSDRNTYVYIFEQKYLEEIKDNKFNILDNIKEIEIEESMPTTLSIAITNEGESDYEKYKKAQESIDIVLGRGGDQAVVREEGKYTFFGGRTLEIEKRTKVKARTVAHALEKLIMEAKDIIIMGHTNPDIDSMGSSLGIYRVAKTLGKEAYIISDKNASALDNLMELIKKEDEYKEVFINKNEAISKINKETLLVIVDTHKSSYVEVPELIEETNNIVIIDHHRKSPEFVEKAILTFHEVYASSAAELVTELLQYISKKVELNTLETEALYAGIMMDTKNFTFKTGVRTFEAAAYLRKCGVDIIRVKKLFQSNLENYKTIAEIVKNVEIINETIGISIYDKDEKDANLICAKAADELLTISDITASFVIGKTDNKVFVSGRSIGDINVQIILEKLGGGGHITVAGAQVEDKTIEEVKEELKEKIEEYFSEN